MNKVSVFSLEKLPIRHKWSNLKLCEMFEWNIILNRRNIGLLTQQVKWLGSKRIELHPWGPKIKLRQQ